MISHGVFKCSTERISSDYFVLDLCQKRFKRKRINIFYYFKVSNFQYNIERILFSYIGVLNNKIFKENENGTRYAARTFKA